MLSLHPNILEKDGKKAFAIISYDEFLKIQEILEDYEDLATLRKAKFKESDSMTVSLEHAKKELGL
ncbi:Uncharacterized protein dnl_25000 [Desulfonema limicola]|uniref:Prevent-host-death family protein n=1 Tax=Desulfonema limicola TaxID=45656 RepID=A0A975B7E4_9BACT|nr:hypothetical protein [Desulfonema limicola]QTA80206.1 Uncharacterized protein dnl_25000 [Desulfonema limicola]